MSSNEFLDSLSALGLAQYHDKFVEEAFDTWEILVDITESDLDALGVKLGHRRVLQRAITDYRRKNSYDTGGYGIPEDADVTAKADPVLAADEEVNGNGASRTSVNGKRRYRRHPKPDEYAPDRPPSAYVLFSNQTRVDLKGQEPSFTEIAKTVGERWRVLPHDEKAKYENRSQAAKDTYYARLAEYKKTPEYAEYQKYLAEFKAKHDTPSQDAKRKRDEKMPISTRYGNGGPSSPENISTSAESSEQRGSTTGSPTGTPQSKYQKQNASDSAKDSNNTRQCNAAAADSSSFSPKLSRYPMRAPSAPDRSKSTSFPDLPTRQTQSEHAFAQNTPMDHPMAISTQLAYGYIPNIGSHHRSSSHSHTNGSQSANSLSHSATPPPLPPMNLPNGANNHGSRGADPSPSPAPGFQNSIEPPTLYTTNSNPNNDPRTYSLPGPRIPSRQLPPLISGNRMSYPPPPPLRTEGMSKAGGSGMSPGIASLLRAGEQLEMRSPSSAGGANRENQSQSAGR